MREYEGCDKCSNQGKSMFDYPCFECTHNRATDHYKPMTNADRIRNMTDEELAEFLVKVNSTTPECTISGCNTVHNGKCENCVLGWLQAEVKEGDTDE